MDQVFIRCDDLVAVQAVIQADSPFEGQIFQRGIDNRMGSLEPADRLPVVLQSLGLIDKSLHLLVFVIICCVNVRIEAYRDSVRIQIGEIGGSRSFGKPQAGVASLIAVPAASEIFDGHTEGILIFKRFVYLDT